MGKNRSKVSLICKDAHLNSLTSYLRDYDSDTEGNLSKINNTQKYYKVTWHGYLMEVSLGGISRK